MYNGCVTHLGEVMVRGGGGVRGEHNGRQRSVVEQEEQIRRLMVIVNGPLTGVDVVDETYSTCISCTA